MRLGIGKREIHTQGLGNIGSLRSKQITENVVCLDSPLNIGFRQFLHHSKFIDPFYSLDYIRETYIIIIFCCNVKHGTLSNELKHKVLIKLA